MKHLITFVTGVLLILMLISGCSKEPSSIELISSYSEISDDSFDPMLSMDKEYKGEDFQLISLNYYFTLLNLSDETLGSMDINPKTYRAFDGIELSLEPNKKFKRVLQDVLGIDCLVEKYGIARSGISMIEAGKEEEYIIYFVLGANKENPEYKLAPSQEQLDKLKRNSMEATLIVSIGDDNEIARFNLNRFK